MLPVERVSMSFVEPEVSNIMTDEGTSRARASRRANSCAIVMFRFSAFSLYSFKIGRKSWKF